MATKNGQNAEFKAQQGKGRKKGVPNKNTTALKNMILGALENKGGIEYLARQADENPVAFMALIGKVLPHTIAGSLDHKFEGLRVTIKR